MANSWKDLIGLDFVVTTGDGKVYTPQYLTASVNRTVEYNIAEFVFKNTYGSLVKRGMPKGTRYDVELIFQGADCIDVADSFEKSCRNPAPVSITHPMYGQLLVQPLTLSQDNGKLNISKVTLETIETILDSGLQSPVNAQDAVTANTTNITGSLNNAYSNAVAVPGTADLAAMNAHAMNIFGIVSAKIANVQADATQYQNDYLKAINLLNPALYSTAQIIGQLQTLINDPALFADTVVNRLNQLSATLAYLGNDVGNIVGMYNTPTASLKGLYQNNAGAAVNAMCLACVTNVTNDYNYAPAVVAVIDTLLTAYNGYMSNLQLLQSPTGGEVDSFVPDATALTQLQQNVYYTIQTLYAIAATAKQQRTYTLPYDSNLILVAWKLYGLQPDDSTIKLLMANNNIQLGEVLVMKAGRAVVYYV